MSIPYIISVMSHDRVGIIADVTAAIKTLHGNLEDLSQTVLRGYFSMILLARFPDGTTEDQLRQALHAVKDLAAFEIGIEPFDENRPPAPPANAADNTYVLTASGPDNIGLVAALAEYLRQKNINIVDLATRRENDDYIMMFLVSLPPALDVAKLQHSLKIAMEAIGLEVGLRHRALFRHANEI
ncbi:MAG: hypothetical protein PHC30_03255 [Lentisphaeria bacterium]|jgi:glycine cleavage system transcriptional repressor|nr:hypothetical protein [Lentisphaeria bacterium]